MSKLRIRPSGLCNLIIGALGILIIGAREVTALSESQKIALVPDASGRSNFGGALPTSGFPGGYAPTFTNVDPVRIGVTESLSGFDTVVLVGICDIGSATFLGNPAWRSTIDGFVAGGGKLIIWDSECQNTDYSNFVLPFTTNNPGQLGANGTLSITEENSLSRSSPFSPRFVDVGLVGSQTDAVGDANVFIGFDPRWCVDMRAINASIGAPARPTHTYAGTAKLPGSGLGNGLIIYNGLDKDVLANGQGFGTGNGRENLGRIWLFELLQPFNPDGLPCGVAATCGNGTIDPQEQCDPAAQPTGCPAGQNCSVNDCVCVTPPSCGDGFINPPEQCDPQAVPTGCGTSLPVCNPASCQCEQPSCGNNQVEAGEQCDGTADAACPGACLPPGDANQCQCPRCGDDDVNQPSEECDGIDQSNCTVGCNPPGDPQECRCVGGPRCGDGMVDPGEQCDDGNTINGDGCSSTCQLENQPPDCSAAVVRPRELWPPNHQFARVSVNGVTDPNGDPVAITVTGITQDESLKTRGDDNTCPDAIGVGKRTARLRVERAGTGDGRVYHVSFAAEDGQGGQCTGTVTVCVPHDQRPGYVCIDQGARVVSTGPCG